jgi:hypothetical protein
VLPLLLVIARLVDGLLTMFALVVTKLLNAFALKKLLSIKNEVNLKTI